MNRPPARPVSLQDLRRIRRQLRIEMADGQANQLEVHFESA
jgi:hypothetical protein